MGSALRVAVGRIARRLRQAQAVGEVTLSEFSVLARLDGEGPASPGVLADQERVRPQAMATTLAALEQRGLVRRRADANDGRRVLVSVTEAGRTMLVGRRCRSTEVLAEALGEGFTEDEREVLHAALPLLERLAGRL